MRTDAILLVDHAKTHAGKAPVEIGERLAYRGTCGFDDPTVVRTADWRRGW
jgi:hypothetical protein